MKKNAAGLLGLIASFQFVALLCGGTVTGLVYAPTLWATNGQCQWEGGSGAAGGYAYCMAEDCLGAGGLAQCSAGAPAAPPSISDSLLGADKWVYSACDEGGPSIPVIARWCSASGGTWVITGASTQECQNLPPGMLGIASSSKENLIVETSDRFMGVGSGGSCPVNFDSETQWGTQTDSYNCWSGSTSYHLNIPIQQLRLRSYKRACDNATIRIILLKSRSAKCPAGYRSRNSIRGAECYLPDECCNTFGNPVSPISGAKTQEEIDYQPSAQGALTFSRYYRSTGYYRPTVLSTGISSPNIEQRDYWRHSYDKRLTLVSGNSQVLAILENPNGSVTTFDTSGRELANHSGGAARLQAVAGIGWDVTLANSDVERYNSSGQLISITSRAGMVTTLTYSGGRLATISNAFGHVLGLGYNAHGFLSTVTLPNAGVIQYAYDDFDRLVTVTYPDSASRTYHYENAVYRWALTGISNENGQRFSTYTYDSDGRAIVSEHANGVNRYQFSFGTTPTTVTDPLGTTTQVVSSVAAGVYRRGSYSVPCMDCGSARSVTYDLNGNPASRVDFNGNQTVHSYDLTRNLEISRTEAYGSPVARTITTQWHPTFRLPIEINEPGRRTIRTYDASGNVLTRTVTDTATDNSRTWSYTYNAVGQMLTKDGPRSDASDVTTYVYNNCSYGAECGQLSSVTNAAGHATSYLSYNAHGQPLSILDANGVMTTLTYDTRQRVTSRDVGGEVTSLSYYPTGLLKRVTLPDGSYLEYSYDAAHRLVGVEDSEGNRISYTLNGAGQRTMERIFDPSQVLVRLSSRAFDALGRVLSEMDATNYSVEYGYDLNGNRDGLVDQELRPTSYAYDELDRQVQVTDPVGGIVQYTYTDRDELKTVTDPRLLTTTYNYNGFGELTQLISPDTGVTHYTRDLGGNLHQLTDARSATATYSYDALDRISQISYADQTITLAYDQGINGKGRLTQLTDAAGTTHWTYSAQGRVTGKQQIVGSASLAVGYGYNSAGQLTQITTPSGQIIGFGYNSGRPTTISVNGSALLSNVLYTPFGPTRGWNWANGTLAVREYDLNGRVTTIDSAGLSTYQFNPDGTIQTWVDDGGALSGAIGLTEFDVAPNSNRITTSDGLEVRTYSYDAAGNILSDGTRSFTYNAAGRMVSAAGTSGSATYAVNGLGQRVRKSVGATTRLFVYDESGQLLGEYDGSGALVQETVWLADIPVAVLKPNGSGGVNAFYIHTDHLNTPRKITRPSDNATVWRWDSDPFGTTLANENPSGLGVFNYNLRFPGQYYDPETGLHYNYFRDYDPATGRYVESDPIGLEAGINTYAYSLNAPHMNSDPLGLYTGSRTPVCNTIYAPVATTRRDWVKSTRRYETDFDLRFRGPEIGIGPASSRQPRLGPSWNGVWDLYRLERSVTTVWNGYTLTKTRTRTVRCVARWTDDCGRPQEHETFNQYQDILDVHAYWGIPTTYFGDWDETLIATWRIPPI